jgi:hypothetical protein
MNITVSGSHGFDSCIRLKWISVEDRFPEEPKPDEDTKCYLTTDGKHFYLCAWYRNLWHPEGEDNPKVSHWMPLPELP